MQKRLRGDVRTTAALRRAIQQSSDSIRTLARRYDINPKTVAKWRRRASTDDLKTGPKEARSSVLTVGEEAAIVGLRLHMPLPLPDCLNVLQPTIPHLTRSSLHRCLQRHGVSNQKRLVRTAQRFAVGRTVLGWFSLRATELQLAHGKCLLFVAIEHASRWSFVQLHDRVTQTSATDFLTTLLKSAPCKAHTLLAHGNAALWSDAFRAACVESKVDLRLNTSKSWSAEQIHRITRTLSQAIDESIQRTGIEFLRLAIANAVTGYNRKCALTALGGQTPLEWMRAHADSAAPRPRTTQLTDGARRAAAQTEDAHPNQSAKKRLRNLKDTREAILLAARSCLAHDGPEGLSVAEVARIAGVNRGTAYKHFNTREQLIEASADWVSNKLYGAVFGGADGIRDRDVGATNIAQLTERLANFAMDNPELCRAWLLKVLSSPNPWSDPFWREYQGRAERFAESEYAQDGIDPEALSVIMLAGTFLWPVWARVHAKAKTDLQPLAYRFTQECLRLSMYGNLRSERYPEVAKRLKDARAHARRVAR